MTSGSIRLHASVLVLACLRPSSLSECEYISPFLSLSPSLSLSRSHVAVGIVTVMPVSIRLPCCRRPI